MLGIAFRHTRRERICDHREDHRDVTISLHCGLQSLSRNRQHQIRLIGQRGIDKSVQPGHIALSIKALPAIMRILQQPGFFKSFLQASFCIFDIR